MTYKDLETCNNRNKILGKAMYRVTYVNLKHDICTLMLGNSYTNMAIKVVIQQVMQGMYCLSNPSSLSKYNFNVFDNTESVSIRTRMLSDNTLLFHGSDGGIKGTISVNSNRGLNDFGNGFYTGESLLQAENRVANSGNGVVYAYHYSLNSLSVYSFDDPVLWCLYIGYNRNRLPKDTPSNLFTIFSNIDSFDVVAGIIADDRISRVYSAFLDGAITDKCLIECLRLVDYGRQFVFKTDKSIRNLTLVSSYKITKEIKKSSVVWGRKMKDNVDSRLDELAIKYEEDGSRIRRVLRRYEK